MNAIHALLLLTTPAFIGTLISGLECDRNDFQIEDLKFTESPYINRFWHCADDASARMFPNVGAQHETWFAFDTASHSSQYHGYPRKVLQEIANTECNAVNVDARHAVPVHNMESTAADTDTDTDTDTNAVTAAQIAFSLRGDVFDFSAHIRQLCAIQGFRQPFAHYCRESRSMCAIPRVAECTDFFFGPNRQTTSMDPYAEDGSIQDPCAHLLDSVQLRDAFFEWRRLHRNATKYAYSDLCFFDRFFICRASPSSSSSHADTSNYHSNHHNRISAVLLSYNSVTGQSVYEFAPTFDPNANAIAFMFEIIHTYTNAHITDRRLLDIEIPAPSNATSSPVPAPSNSTSSPVPAPSNSTSSPVPAPSNSTSAPVPAPSNSSAPTFAPVENVVNIDTDDTCVLYFSIGNYSEDAMSDPSRTIYSLVGTPHIFEVRSPSTLQQESWPSPLTDSNTYHLELALQTDTLNVEAESHVLTFQNITGLGTEFRITTVCANGYQTHLSSGDITH